MGEHLRRMVISIEMNAGLTWASRAILWVMMQARPFNFRVQGLIAARRILVPAAKLRLMRGGLALDGSLPFPFLPCPGPASEPAAPLGDVLKPVMGTQTKLPGCMDGAGSHTARKRVFSARRRS